MALVLTREELVARLTYDPETGVFTHLKNGTRGVKVGDVAGAKSSFGYWNICINGVRYRAHRLAWLYVHGVMPDGQVDHIDRNRLNNSIKNLRCATNAQNQHNTGLRKTNTSGHKNVFWNVARKVWQVQLTFMGRPKTVGRFKELADAVAKAQEFRAAHHGEFAVI